MNYYNEWDKDAAAWLRELIKAGLIPPGDVDERSITEVKAHELTQYRQAHFFCGIGGWPLAFQLAEVDSGENADTGSCPCQPFSGTGKQMGFSDPRHLWPAFRRVIGKRQPAKVYGEQVASKLGREWLSRVFSDLAFMGYAGSGADLCSAGVGSPNIRQRLYWMGDSMCIRRGEGARQHGEIQCQGSGKSEPAITGRFIGVEHSASDGREQRGSKSIGGGSPGGCEFGRLDHTVRGGLRENGTGGRSAENGRGDREDIGSATKNTGSDGRMADSTSQRIDGVGGVSAEPRRETEQERIKLGGSKPVGGLAKPNSERLPSEHALLRAETGERGQEDTSQTSWRGPARIIEWTGGAGIWSECEAVFCRDQKWRRIESGSFPLANGIPSRVGPLLTELRKLGRSSIALARANRNFRLKGYGNAINPWVAARFILATRSTSNGILENVERVEV